MNNGAIFKGGNQNPSFIHTTPSRSSSWEVVRDIAKAYGLELDEWQENVLEASMGELSTGKWSTPRVGVSVPRQNGKNALIEARELAGLLIFDEKVIIHSAHEQKTARNHFERIRSYFENYDDLRKKVRTMQNSLSREEIVLTNGCVIKFPARSKGASRGFSVDLLVLDEAQELPEATFNAILPTMAARPNAQMWLLGTPPSPQDNGEVFQRFHDDGHMGTDRRLCWIEWLAPNDCDLDDRANWEASNPVLGNRIPYLVVEDERAALSDEGFARERLGVWDTSSTHEVIDSTTWADRLDESSTPLTNLTLAVDVSPDRSTSSVALSGYRSDGLLHVELDEQRQGTAWVVPWVVDRCRNNDINAVVIDSIGPAASLVEQIEKFGIRVTSTKTADVAIACANFYDAVIEGTVRHIGQPQLDAALTNARRRSIGDSWAWNRKNATSDITPLVAVTLASWGASAKNVQKALRKQSNRNNAAPVIKEVKPRGAARAKPETRKVRGSVY